jgi:quercetin dioxygenase-like cupin family protein
MTTIDTMSCQHVSSDDRVDGAALSAGIQTLRQNEIIDIEAGTLGEEVGAILSGRIDVVAAGEHYVLCAGEAIVIPAGEARRFACLTERCELYRVTVRAYDNVPGRA